jgi:hypothetical protein
MRLVSPGGILPVYFLLLLSFSVRADTDLAISASSSPPRTIAGGIVHIIGSISNFGEQAAQDVVVSVTLAAGVNLLSVTSSQGACSIAGSIVCNLGDIGAGTLGIQATVSVEMSSDTAGPFNTAFGLSTSTPETTLSNNSVEATTDYVPLIEAADLELDYVYPVETLLVDGLWSLVALTGSIVETPLRVTNHGPAVVTSTRLEFSVPLLRLSAFDSVTSSQGRCATPLNTCAGFGCLAVLDQPVSVHCDLGSLAVEDSATVNVRMFTRNDQAQTLITRAQVDSADRVDSVTANNEQGSSILMIEEPSCGENCGTAPGCFIATVAYGSDMHDDVEQLRRFRDEWLVGNIAGQQFVNWYYRVSPPLADAIRDHEYLKAIIRGLLYVPVVMIRYPALFMLSVLMLVFWAGRRIVRKRVAGSR